MFCAAMSSKSGRATNVRDDTFVRGRLLSGLRWKILCEPALCTTSRASAIWMKQCQIKSSEVLPNRHATRSMASCKSPPRQYSNHSIRPSSWPWDDSKEKSSNLMTRLLLGRTSPNRHNRTKRQWCAFYGLWQA